MELAAAAANDGGLRLAVVHVSRDEQAPGLDEAGASFRGAGHPIGRHGIGGRPVPLDRNAAAVGDATTKAVVSGITAIIALDGIFAVICNALHI